MDRCFIFFFFQIGLVTVVGTTPMYIASFLNVFIQLVYIYVGQ